MSIIEKKITVSYDEYFKFKKVLEDVKNEILKSLKSLLNTFENRCADHGPIIESKPCIFNHIKEIEIQTEADSQTIVRHVQNAIEKCVRTKNDINTVLMNHDRVRCTNGIAETKWDSNCEHSFKYMKKQLEYEKQHFTDIVNDLKNKIYSMEDTNQVTFTSFSKIMSNVINLQMKRNCIYKVNVICAETYTKVTNFEETCRQTGKSLDFLIENCKSTFSMATDEWGVFMSEWNVLQAQYNGISDNISNYVDQYVEMNKSLDELILQKESKLNDLMNNYQATFRLKQKAQDMMYSSETALDKLIRASLVTENTKDTYITQVNQLDMHEEKLLISIKDLQENIDKQKSKKHAEFIEEDHCHYNINDYNLYDLDSALCEKLKPLISQFDEMTNKIRVLEKEKYELRQLGDSRVVRLQEEKKRKKERQSNIMNSKIYEKRHLLDLTNKEMDNVQVEISRYKDVSGDVIRINNELERCIKVLQTFYQNVMIENHGKSLEKLIQENGELSLTEIYLADQIRNLRTAAGSQLQMEALLEERIRLLQDRMKAITAQREQIEKANRGLEEELNKLTTNFYKTEKNVNGTDETDEENPI